MKLFRRPPERSSRVDVVMNTVVSQVACGVNASGALTAALREARRLEKLLSRFLPDSDIGKLNRSAAPGTAVRLHSETATILALSLEISRLSGGVFDITSAPLSSLWRVTSEHPVIPDNAVIAEARKLVDYRNLIVNPANTTARLARQGQMVDLGGIAKGYAADRMLDIYRKHKMVSGMVDLGGNVAVLGPKEDGSPWIIGIQDPDGVRGEYIGTLALSHGSVVTSGDYERSFEVDGKRYHHIIDPRTGYPAESDLRSVTVVAADSTTADALSTPLFILGLEDGLEMLKAYNESHAKLGRPVEALFVTSANEVHITPGLVGFFASSRAPVTI